MSRTIDITNGFQKESKVTEIIFASRIVIAPDRSTVQAYRLSFDKFLGHIVITDCDGDGDKVIISSADHARKLIQALELAIEEEMFQ